MADYRVSRTLLVAIVLVGQLWGCSGGKGNGAPGRQESLPPAAPGLMFSTLEISEPVSIGSDASQLYLGSMRGLTAVDKLTWHREPLSGGIVDPATAPSELGIVEHPSDIIRSGDWLYFDSWGYRIQRLFLGADGTAPVEEILPTAGLRASCCQLEAFAADDQRIYWVLWDGNGSWPLYSRALDGGDIRLLTTFSAAPDPGVGVQLTAAASFLYVVTVEFVPTLRRVDVVRGGVEVVEAGVALPADLYLPRAASASRFFWMDGTTLRAVAHGSLEPEVIATGLTGVTQLATDDAAVYALQVDATQATLQRVDLASGAITTVATAPDIRGVVAYQGKVWWVSPWSLYASEPDGTATSTVYDGDIVLGPPFGVSQRVVVWCEAGLLVHDISGGTTTVITPMGVQNIAVNSQALYVEDYNEGVHRIPVDAPLRVPETLAGDVSTVETMFLDQGWLYWSEYSDFWGVYRISRMRTDGTGRQVLFDGVHRQLALLDGQLFFLCEAACSLPGWTLVSMPLEGGSVTPVATVGLHPQQLIARNGLLYLVDTDDGASFGVWALDVAGRRSAKVVSGLPLAGTRIDVSARWVYVWSGGLCLDPAFGVVDRRRVEAWDRLSVPQPVDTAASCANPVFAFHTDGTALFYWLRNDGLKRCAE